MCLFCNMKQNRVGVAFRIEPLTTQSGHIIEFYFFAFVSSHEKETKDTQLDMHDEDIVRIITICASFRINI